MLARGGFSDACWGISKSVVFWGEFFARRQKFVQVTKVKKRRSVMDDKRPKSLLLYLLYLSFLQRSLAGRDFIRIAVYALSTSQLKRLQVIKKCTKTTSFWEQHWWEASCWVRYLFSQSFLDQSSPISFIEENHSRRYQMTSSTSLEDNLPFLLKCVTSLFTN